MPDASDLESGEIEESSQADDIVNTSQMRDISSGNGSLKRKLVDLDHGSEVTTAVHKPKKVAGKGYYDIYGAEAVPEIDIKSDSLRLVDVQQLVCFILSDGLKPTWVHIKNRPLIKQVVLVAVPGLSWPLQRRCKEHMPFCERTFGKPAVCRVTTGTQAAGSALASLMTVAISKTKKKEQRKDAKKAKSNALPPHPPSYYTLDLEAMRALKYPVPTVTEDGRLQAPAGYVWTASCADARQGDCGTSGRDGCAKPKAGADNGRAAPEQAQWNCRNATAVLDMPHLACGATLYALDCEMCITENGFELTRISMVDHTGKCVMDELVVPDTPITDYNTQYSGITAEMLEGVKTRLPDIQKRLCSLVTEDCILVGHSLENDFRALRFLHGNCIDTAHLYPHPKGPPHRCALRVLAERYLHRKIQQGSHDSVQDATAAMELVLLKIKNGPKFGCSEKDGEPLAATLSRAGCQCSLVDCTSIVRKYVDGSSHAHGAESDADVVGTARREISKLSADHERPANKFVFARLLPLQTLFVGALDHIRETLAASNEAGTQGNERQPGEQHRPNGRKPGQHGLPSGEGPSGAVEEAVTQLDHHLQRLWESTVPGSLFMVVSLGGNTYYTRWLMETKLRRQQGLDGLPPWNQACEEHYAKASDDAIRGCFFAAIKRDADAVGV